MKNEALKLFMEMDEHICHDTAPSLYFWDMDNPLFWQSHPFVMLERLKKVKQSPKHHPEGSVWNHTMLVLDEAAARKGRASDARVFMWAALLHDIGKADTIRLRRGNITAYNHDRIGAELSQVFLEEFCDAPFAACVSALVRFHMQVLYVTKSMRFTDIDRMKQETNVYDIALLGLCDRLGRKDVNRQEEEQHILDFLRKVEYEKQ